MRENKIKARSFKYDYDPEDDNFVSHVGDKYHVCRISAELIGTYTQFESFLREIFKHEHFLDISSIEIVPYQKNKRILLINMQIKLYAQRDPSSIVKVEQSDDNAKGKKSKKGKSKDKKNDTPPDIKKEQ
jgi:Tfp pilus assembly protein PilO